MAQEFDFQDELQKMWLEVELYYMQVNKILVSISYVNLIFLQRCFPENTKQEIWGLRALCNYIKHPNVD